MCIRPVPRRKPAEPTASPREQALATKSDPPKPRKPRAKQPDPTLTARDLLAAESLIRQVLATDEQKIPSADLELGPKKLERIISRSIDASNRPHGKKLALRRVGGYWNGEEELYLAQNFGDFVEEKPVPVPERVAKYHPAVKEFLADKQWQYVTKEHVSRAARILQAIASEAERRGVEVIPQSKKPPSRRQIAPQHGNLWFVTEYGHYGIEIKRIAGTGAKKFGDLGLTWQQRRNLPSWIERRGWEFLSTGRLQINQGTSFDSYSVERLNDARGTPLEDRLPEVFVRFDTWLLEQSERKRQNELAEEQRQRNWEAAMVNARADYLHAERWRHFVTLVEEDELFNKYEAFLTKAKSAIDHLPSEQLFAANGFLSEVETTLRERSPLKHPERFIPEIPDPNPEDLKPYLHGWSPYGPDRR